GNGRVEAASQRLSDLLDTGAVAHLRKQHGKLVAAQPRQQLVGAELLLHALCCLLQIEVSDAMAVQIVRLLELIEADVDQAEDGGILARLFNLGVYMLLQGEAVVNVGEQVELRVVQKLVGIKPQGLDGQGGQSSAHGEGLRLDGAGFGKRVERGEERAQRRPGTGRNLLADDAQGSELRRTVSQPCSIGDLAPAGSAVEGEGDQFRDLFNDLSEWTRTVDVLEDVAAHLFELGRPPL